ncbi:MAG: hypothetical protein JWN14_918, partial [Chthonomonadales bacterium]|nr:hypothetical protein [Chthonomonadales bacterium]
LFAPPLAEVKAKTWETVSASLDKHFETLTEGIERARRQAVRECDNAFNQRLDTYCAKYQATIDDLRHQQERDSRELQQREETLQAERAEIADRKERISRRLAAMKGLRTVA